MSYSIIWITLENINKRITSLLWARWRLKSPASRLFTQPFIQAQIKENTKAPRHWPLCGEITGTGEFPAQRASNAENVSIWWRHNVNPPRTADITTTKQSTLKPSTYWTCYSVCGNIKPRTGSSIAVNLSPAQYEHINPAWSTFWVVIYNDRWCSIRIDRGTSDTIRLIYQ